MLINLPFGLREENICSQIDLVAWTCLIWDPLKYEEFLEHKLKSGYRVRWCEHLEGFLLLFRDSKKISVLPFGPDKSFVFYLSGDGSDRSIQINLYQMR